jgi:hypothetical protein
VEGNSRSVLTRDGFGDFYRPLAPGRYTVTVSKAGFKPLSVNLTVPEDGSGAQRHFVLAREGSSSEGEVAYTPHGLAPTAAAEGGGSVLPWKAARRRGGGGPDAAGTLTAATRARDRMLMMGAGVLVVYGLWVTHRRLSPRSLMRRR